MTSSWPNRENELCLVLFRLNQAGCVTSEVSRPGYASCPASWRSHIRDAFRESHSEIADIALVNAYLKLPKAISLDAEPSVTPFILQCLQDQILSMLENSELEPTPEVKLLLGRGFKAYVELASQSVGVNPALWNPVISVASKFSKMSIFLEAILAYISTFPEAIESDSPALDGFADTLILNLFSPSHSLRLLSLEILKELVAHTAKNDPSPISLAIEIEETPLTLQSARTISMQVRKLAIHYPQFASQRWMGHIVPYFYFGLFSKKMTPLWDDAAAALKSLCENAYGEKIVSELAIRWLQEQGSLSTSGSDADHDDDEDNSNVQVSRDFQCSNELKIEGACSSTFQVMSHPSSVLVREFEQDHALGESLPVYPRAHALRVLNAAPNIAEKHSRQIVPLFLSWARHDEDENASNSGPDESLSSTGDLPWGFKDRLAMLGLFGQFINPLVLYKSSDVYEALLELICHGNSEIQRSALRAIFTWKSPHIVRYQENLLNILDEKRLRDELTAFVHVGRDDSVIEEEHKGELLPILLRLLYGRMISKASTKAAQSSQTGRRKAILRTLSLLPDEDFEVFMEIAFGPFAEVQVVKDGQVDEMSFSQELVSPKRQMGLLRMIESMFETLQSRMYPYAERSMDVIVYCLVRACRALEKEQTSDGTVDDQQQEQLVTVLRGLRQVCIRCLDLVFSVSLDKEWGAYVRIIFNETINPRLNNFAIETAQGISGLLRLFHTWASAPRSSYYLVRYNDMVLTKIVDCLGVDSARDEVKLFVMDEILVPIIEFSSGKDVHESENMSDFAPQEIRLDVLSPYIEHILSHLGRLLRRGPSRPILISGVHTLSLIAPCVESSSETSGLISVTTYLLRQPPDRVSPKTKSGLLHILEHFLPLYNPREDVGLSQQVFEAISSMFDYFKDDENRGVLAKVFMAFAHNDSELVEVAALCDDLNSISRKKLEVDYERRLQAFRRINENLWEKFSAKQWRPLLFNMLYHVKDEEELAIRSSASFGLKRFIEKATISANSGSEEFETLLMHIAFPALQYGVRQKPELIRSEIVSVLGFLVKLNPTKPAVQDMHVLLVGDDEEASFFSNILHIQQHRRQRALRRLASEAASAKLQAVNINSIFMPLVEHFVFAPSADENAHNLTAEAVTTLGTIAEWLDWNQFRATFRRYRGYMQSKPELERSVIRLLGRMSDALSNAVSKMSWVTEDRGDDQDEKMSGVEPATTLVKTTLSQSIPSTSKVSAELTANFIPQLTDFVHYKDESEMSLRLPAAVTTVKLLKLLPEEEMGLRLQPVLLDVCSILKSKAQDSRDTARKTLNEIAMLLGPEYFGHILKELRGTLARGYQRHVLSYTVHSILVATTDQFKQGDLDYCLGDLAAVVMDDIFGATGQEKDAEEYVSGMKEVKSSKSYDSMELLAKNSTVRKLSHLVLPLRGLLQEKLTSSLVKKVDELLRRIGVGLLRNPGAESRDMLVFCYEVIKESYKDQEPIEPEPQSTGSASENRFLVNLQGAKRGEDRGTTSSYVYKLNRFALDVLRSILSKHDSLLTVANVSGLLPVIGDALVQAHDEVKISALRLLSTIIKLPLDEIDKNSHVYLTEAVKVIKESPSTNTEIAQASLKLIATMIRERRGTKLRDGHLAYLLKRLIADIEEPDRQGVTFNFIRAVMNRKFVVPEIYELADHIAAMMVTNQTRSARDLARGVYIHFLVEYPQAKNRWAKQLGFLAKNLEFKYAEGRQSVMEALHMLLMKTDGELSQDIVGTFFLPIVIVMTNDDAPECREMAGMLLGEFYSRADKEQMETIMAPLHTWLEQTDNTVLGCTGLQAMRIYFEVEGTEKEKQARFVVGVLPGMIKPITTDRENENWQSLYFALQLFTKLCKAVPSVGLSKDCRLIWNCIRESMVYPHAWVKTCAANIIGMWLADLAKSNADSGYASLPLVGSAGLRLDKEAMRQLLHANMRSLRTPGIREELAIQCVRNLIFLSRCCAQNGLDMSKALLLSEEQGAEDSGMDDGLSDTAEEVNGKGNSTKPAIRYIFEQISSILRREVLTTRAESLTPKTASMGLLTALCRHFDSQQISPYISIILLPLQYLTDPTIPPPRSSDERFRTTYKELVSSGHEVLDILQGKLGPTEYITQMAIVQDSVRSRREDRRAKRRIEAVVEPEKHGNEKKRRNDRKHEKRKEKGLEHRGKRRGF